MLRLALKLLLGCFVLALLGIGYIVYLFASEPFGPGYDDFAASLPHGYSLVRSSAHQIIIWPGDGSPERAEAIPTKVVELAHNGTWLLARQQHLQRRSPNNPDDTYEEPVPDTYSYWILNMATHQRFGPLDETAFNAKQTELGLNDGSLRLQSVYDFRP